MIYKYEAIAMKICHSTEHQLDLGYICVSEIRDTFPTSGSFNDAPDMVPPAFNTFKPVTEDEVSKYINESPTKSCPLAPYQHSSLRIDLIYSFRLLPSW